MEHRGVTSPGSTTSHIDATHDLYHADPNAVRLAANDGNAHETAPSMARRRHLAGLHPSTFKVPGSRHFEAFTPLLFMDDYARLALTDRTALLPEVQTLLSFYKHLVATYSQWKMDSAIEEDGNQSADHYTEDFLCSSCGVNPGAYLLGYDECLQCYDEH